MAKVKIEGMSPNELCCERGRAAPRRAGTDFRKTAPFSHTVAIKPLAMMCQDCDDCKVSGLRRQPSSGFCHEPLVWSLAVEGSMGSVVVVVVLPFAKLIVEQVDVVGNAVFVQ
jgi:hypothetical protein